MVALGLQSDTERLADIGFIIDDKDGKDQRFAHGFPRFTSEYYKYLYK